LCPAFEFTNPKEPDMPPPGPPPVTFDGYPTHATQPSDLPPPLFVKMKAYALGVACVLSLPQYVTRKINLLVEGHADHDPQGPDFEMQVSVDRANNCKALLLSEVQTAATGMFLDLTNLTRLSVDTVGWGAKSPVVANPTSEEDREKNRRVVVNYLLGDPIAKADPADRARQALALFDGQPETAHVRRLRCMLTKIRDMPDVKDGYPDSGEAHRTIPGSGGFP